MREVIHPTWGSNRERQVSAKAIISEPMIGLRVADHDERDDSKFARRTFEHRCALVRGVFIPHEKKENSVVLFLDGHPIAELRSSEVAMTISSALDGGPTADIIFRGDGLRYGDLVNVKHLSAVLTFSSLEQIRTFIELFPSKDSNQKVGIVPVGGPSSSTLAFAAGAAVASDLSGDGVSGD